MQRDLPKVVKEMAGALGLQFTDAEIKQFADASSFDVMKNNAEQFAPESGTDMWKAETAFFATGKIYLSNNIVVLQTPTFGGDSVRGVDVS